MRFWSSGQIKGDAVEIVLTKTLEQLFTIVFHLDGYLQDPDVDSSGVSIFLHSCCC